MKEETANIIANAVKAIHEEEELDALVDILGGEDAQVAVHDHQLSALIASVQL